MEAFLLSRAPRSNLRPSPISFSLIHHLLDSHISTSPVNPKPSDPPFNPKSTENKKFGIPRHSWIGVWNLHLSIASISTASGVAEGGKNGGDRLGGDEGPKVDVSGIDLCLPESVRPYALLARLDKPIGTWLLAWPCMWSIALAVLPGNLPDIKMMLLFGCGSLLLRGAGCTINDLLDCDIDIKVERTKSRPVASGLLTPYQGITFLGIQLYLGLGILLQLNNYCRVLGALSLLLVFSCLLMKGLIFWPQAYLGLTFN